MKTNKKTKVGDEGKLKQRLNKKVERVREGITRLFEKAEVKIARNKVHEETDESDPL